MPSVILVIKTPSLKLSDLTYCCDPESNVYQLKVYLQNQYPSKPKPEEQRLIYQGKLLRDEEVFQDFLRDLDKEQKHTLHLVYTLKRTPSAEAQERQASPVADTPITMNDGLRLRNTTPAAPEASQGTPDGQEWSSMQNIYPGWASNTPGADDMARQMMWWQQTYQQYWAQYLYHMNSGQQPIATPPNTQAPQPAPVAPVAPVVNPAPAPANLEPAQQEVPRAPQLAAVGGVAQEDDDEARVARDWLDWMYIGSRLIILVGVICYYSSLPRLMLVSLIVAGIYFYQKTMQRRRDALLRNQEINNNGAQEAPQAAAAPEAPDNAAPANEPALEGGEAAVNQVNERNQNVANPSGLNVALNLLIGLFTSLIPEVPAPDALN